MQAALYTQKANRKRLAAEAMHKLAPSERAPPSKAVASGGTNEAEKP
jgi:hypothetical protein